MPDRKRFLYVFPVFQAVYGKPFASFLRMSLNAAANEADKYEFIPHVPERQMLPDLMNKACEIVLNENLDGIIVSDDDCLPPYTAISQLLRRYEAGHPIVLGLGFMRNFPHTTTVGRYFPEGPTLTVDAKARTGDWSGFHWIEHFTEKDLFDEGLAECDFGGFPIALISREAIEKMKAQGPWFGNSLDGGACTHDVYFGAKAKRAGLRIVVDTRIPCGHLAEAHVIDFVNRQWIRQAYAQSQAAKS